MHARQAAIVGDEFRPGFRLQRSWDWSMATSFFLGEMGAGLFLTSLFFNYLPGLILGLLLTSVGKSAGHLMHMGKPMRAWRAIFKPNQSWVSRGLWAIILFTGFGIVHTLDVAGLTFGLLPTVLRPVVIAIAGGAAIVIMLYQGFAMSHSAAIGLWSSGLIPMFGLSYALLGGMSILAVIGYDMLATRPADLNTLKLVQVGLVAYIAIMHFSFLHAAKYGPKGAQQSVALLLGGPMVRWFVSLVVVVGLVLPALVILFGADGMWSRVFVMATILAGYYTFRILIFRAAVFDPIQSFLPQMARFRPQRI